MRVVGTEGINQGATGDVPDFPGLYESSEEDLERQGLVPVPDEAWLGADDRRWQIANEVVRGGTPTHPVEAEIAAEIKEQGAEHTEAIATVANTGSSVPGSGPKGPSAGKAKAEQKKADRSRKSPAKAKPVEKAQVEEAKDAKASASKDEKDDKADEAK